jgi:glycosyltransferase involved in cell wall biosynthesis
MILSIIIPYHDEGIEFITTTINSIKETIDVEPYEIIIVDDFSDEPLQEIEGVTVLRHTENLGVGAAFDTGSKIAKSDNLFIMGSDIRFVKNQWASKIIEEIEKYPTAFICTSCIALLEKNLNIEERRLVNVGNGATILMFHDHKNNPKKPENFRGIIEAQWLKRLNNRDIDSFEIPCILGAAYGVKKSWYEYVDGWALHKKWGTLEPYISLKSWLFGGSCRIAPRIETAHIFKLVGTHGTPQAKLIYNKLMVATLLFDDYKRLIHFLGTNNDVEKGKELYRENLEQIMKKREEYKNKIVYNYMDFFEKFNIDYRPDYILDNQSHLL